MSEFIEPQDEQTNTIVDFIAGVEHEGDHVDIEVSVKVGGKIIVFHTRPFKYDIAWFEYDLLTSKLDFILDDGNVRDFGFPLNKEVAAYMQNAHQILTVLMDPETGEATEGNYVPLILHRP